MARWWERVLVAVTTVAVLVVNAAANMGGINGARTGEVAARYDLPFTPAGWVFSIWGVIYFGLAAFTLYQLAGGGAASPRVAAVRPAYVFTGVANVTWLVFWHHELLWATLAVMLLLLGALVTIHGRLRSTGAMSEAECWCVDVPFGVYLGWIFVATLANLSVVAAYRASPAGFDGIAWSQLMLVLLLGLGVLAWHQRNVSLLVVLAWASAGVALKQSQAPSIALPAMFVAALAGMAAMALLLAGSMPQFRGGAQSTTR